MFAAAKSFFGVTLSSIICFLSTTTGLGTAQLNSVKSIKKVTDNFYTMNYTYDYDIDELLDRGVVNTVDLLAYAGINAVTEDFDGLGGFACTTFNAVNPSGEYLLARNYDYMEAPSMMVWTHPKDGYKSVSMVDLEFLLYSTENQPENVANSMITLLTPYLCVDGMNEKGLSIAVLELEKDPTYQCTENKNLTTTTIIRAVLDKAATVNEAIKLFKTYDIRDMLLGGCTYHYQICDAKGNSVVVEFVDNEMNLIYPQKRSGYDYQAAANYYLSKGVDDEDGFGQERTASVLKALKKTGGVMTEKQAMKALSKVSMDDADLDGYICDTLWSCVYNTDDLTVDICVNLNYKQAYSFSLLKPQSYTLTALS